VPRPTANAVALEAWLVDRCRSQAVLAIGKREVRQYGPGCIRDAALLDEALSVLTEANRAREIQDGRRKLIEVNPALLGGNR
jgi:putative DNA primase/helicase